MCETIFFKLAWFFFKREYNGYFLGFWEFDTPDENDGNQAHHICKATSDDHT